MRAYEKSDRRGVRETCVETAWLGAPAPELVPDEKLWADVFTSYFTDQEPEHAWVVGGRNSRISGYLLGTRDVQLFERAQLRRIPRVLLSLRFLRDPQKRALYSAYLNSLMRFELVSPLKVRAEFPARFFFTLREEARDRALGPRLLDPFLQAMQARGVRGVHTQTLNLNEAAFRFLRRAGFQLVSSWQISALSPLVGAQVELLTWVRPLA